MKTLLTINNAHCRISPRVMLQVSDFTVQAGEHWCVFGANGAGKSSLGRLIAGQMRESALYVCYKNPFEPKLDIHVVSFEEQQRLWQRDDRFDISEYNDSALDQGTTVAQLIISSRTQEDGDAELLDELITELALTDILQQGIRFLSSGQMRKAMLARALYASRDNIPQLIVLDDPLESIDKDSRERIQSCIARFLTANKASIQLVRRQQDIPAYTTHLALMDDMTILVQGPLHEVTASAPLQAMLARKPPVVSSIPVTPMTSEQRRPLDPDKPLIELRRVNASYGDKPVLRDVNWKMEPHHHVVIEGPNGCGKSTLLSLIDGENHKGYGQELFLFGRRKGSGESVWDIKSRFGLVSNELHNKYVKGFRVIDVVVSGFFDSVGLYDNSGSTEVTTARHWLHAFGLATVERNYYHELSFGAQRLVLLARAMVKQPAILILDEPCVGLDDYHRQMILQTLDVIASQSDTRLIYVSHVVGEQPQCINQRLQFRACPEGGYTLDTAMLA